MNDEFGKSETISTDSAITQATELLAEAERIMTMAIEAQGLANQLRQMGEAKVAQAHALFPLPLWEAAEHRH